MKLYLEFLCLFLLCFSPQLFANSSGANRNLTEIHKYIDETGFNGAVLVSKNDKLIIEEYFGYADFQKTTKLTRKHLFSPGSVGKEFTTVGIMLLEEQGRLSYEDKISTFIADLPEWAKNITIHHILSHTSGLPKIKWKKGILTTDAITQLLNSEGLFNPGSGYRYSNLNVVARALVIEAVTNQTFSAFMQNNLFEPAQMRGSYQQLSAKDASPEKVDGDYPTFLNGVTVYVTPIDLMKFEIALTSNVLIPFSRVQAKLDGDELSGQSERALYDFGSFSKDSRDTLLSWRHDGSNPSHHTLKFHDFEQDLVILIMSSDGNKSTLYQIKEKLVARLSASGV